MALAYRDYGMDNAKEQLQDRRSKFARGKGLRTKTRRLQN